MSLHRSDSTTQPRNQIRQISTQPKGFTISTFDTRSRNATGLAAAVAAAAAAAIALAGPASADEALITEKHLGIEDCSTVGSGQFCPANPRNSWPTQTQFLARSGSIKVEFTANQNHCSDIIAHVFIDGREWGSNIVHPGQTDGGYEIPVDRSGLHIVGVQAEGVPGGCNTGHLSSWGGDLRISQVT